LDQNFKENTLGRRQFLAVFGGGGLIAQAGCSVFKPDKSFYLTQQTGGRPLKRGSRSVVEFRTGKDRFSTILDAMMPFQKQVADDIGNKQVIVKVNCGLVDLKQAHCSTHKDALRAVLEFLKPIYDRQIIVSEGTASVASSIIPAYDNYGYTPLKDKYNIKFVDSNLMPMKVIYIHSYKQQPVPVNVNAMYMDPDVYLISAAILKTHDAVVATASLKNVVMGAPQCRFWEKGPGISDKPKMHGGASLGAVNQSGQELSWNIFTLALAGVRPDFSVIDGITTIQGNGPWKIGRAHV
jgi:uncharacterized protein (DUF362 family)